MDSGFSIFALAFGDDANSPGLATAIAGVLRTTGETDRWQMTTTGFWCHLTPKDGIQRSQGWKLHLSATILSAETVLTRALPVLLEGHSAFKFASTIEHVDKLNARHAPRGHSGKFITIYPESDEVAVQLAEALHEATAGLAGPRILSDRPYVPGSLVHYRYGAFVEERRLSKDGLYAWVIFDPDGNPVEDRRGATYLPPKWAPCAFPVVNPAAPENGAKENDPKENRTAGSPGDGAGVLIGDRFLIRVAIRHSNKGGVYRAVDTDTGVDAVVKEARPHVATDLAGRDVRDLLRGEARALEKARPVGVAPRLLKFFEQGEHLFLAQELVPGIQLRQWVLDGIRKGEWHLPVPGALEMAGRVAELMTAAQQAGLIIRDFNPTNIMVRPDGELRLIDLELAVVAGGTDEVTAAGGTPSFSAPEQMEGAPPAIEADYYSLGATICFVVAGAIPVFLADLPKARPLRDRLADWLTVRAETINLPAGIQTLILGLMDDEPQRRWTASAARSALAAAQQPPQRTSRLPGNGLDQTNRKLTEDRLTEDRLTEEQWQEAADGCIGYLLATMNPAHDEQLWRATCYHAGLDQCSVQAGAAGVLGVLTRYFELTGDQRLPTRPGRFLLRQLVDRLVPAPAHRQCADPRGPGPAPVSGRSGDLLSRLTANAGAPAGFLPLLLTAVSTLLVSVGAVVWLTQDQASWRIGLLVPMLQVLVLSVAGFALTAGDITAGQLVAAGSYVGMALSAINLMDALISFLGMQIGAGRVGEILDAQPAVAPPLRVVPVPRGPGRIELRDVSVRMGERKILDQLTLSVPAGASVAVVGRSGTGKSVLVSLVGRLLDPDEGEVLLDGVAVSRLKLAALRRVVTYAFERPALLGATVHDMIAYARPEASRAEVTAAAAIAQADRFIRLLPQGYDTPLARAPMSGGDCSAWGWPAPWWSALE